MNGDAPARVMCIDDNGVLLESLKARIARDPRLEWVGDSETGEGLVGLVRTLRVGIILMDVDMPGVDTFALVDAVSRNCPSVRIAMLSGHIHPEYVSRAIDAGAWGYLSKNDDVDALMENIARIAAGEMVFSEDIRVTLKR